MSSTIQQYFTSDDLNMLRRVLDNAGLHDTTDERSRLARRVAGRFLIGCFQQGISTEMELRFELFHHLYQDTSERVRMVEIADLQAWENEGGSVVSAARPKVRRGLRLVAGQTSNVRRIMLGFPPFTLSHTSWGTDDDIPRMLMAA